MDLKEIRNQIDQIDTELLDLFLKRMDLSVKVAEYKMANNLPVLNREREREILKDVMEKSGEDEAYAYRLFQVLMALSKAKQGNILYGSTPMTDRIKSSVQPLEAVFPETGTVACQGVEGANSQEACEKLVKRGNIMYVKTFEAVFDAVDTVKMCLQVFTPMLATMTVRADNMKKAAQGGFINATDLADYLVKKGLPFRSAYKISGQIVAKCIAEGLVLETMPLEAYQAFSPLFEADVFEEIDLLTCVEKRISQGGTSTASVNGQIAYVQEKLEQSRKAEEDV